jgi:hypothetical protein
VRFHQQTISAIEKGQVCADGVKVANANRVMRAGIGYWLSLGARKQKLGRFRPGKTWISMSL